VIIDAEIERRKPVWAALSELWLDTELEEDDLGRIAGVMEASGYPIAFLRDIYLYEVAPVVFWNLLTVAGEWQGFDQEWLVAEATKRARRRSLMLRALIRLGIGRRLMTFATERHWETLVEMMGERTSSSEGCRGRTDRRPRR
jgi:GNAT superfamily N-acetyltransferase